MLNVSLKNSSLFWRIGVLHFALYSEANKGKTQWIKNGWTSKKFYTAAEKKTKAERDAYLDVACGSDKKLRPDVETLLKAQRLRARL